MRQEIHGLEVLAENELSTDSENWVVFISHVMIVENLRHMHLLYTTDHYQKQFKTKLLVYMFASGLGKEQTVGFLD